MAIAIEFRSVSMRALRDLRRSAREPCGIYIGAAMGCRFGKVEKENLPSRGTSVRLFNTGSRRTWSGRGQAWSPGLDNSAGSVHIPGLNGLVLCSHTGQEIAMLISNKMEAAINAQIGNEFGAHLQYVSIGAHFGSESLPELSKHFHKQAAEERDHALRFVNYLVDAGAKVRIPPVPAPKADFKTAEEAVK